MASHAPCLMRNPLREIRCLNPFGVSLCARLRSAFLVPSLQRSRRRNLPAVNVTGLNRQITCHRHWRACALRYRSGRQAAAGKDEQGEGKAWSVPHCAHRSPEWPWTLPARSSRTCVNSEQGLADICHNLGLGLKRLRGAIHISFAHQFETLRCQKNPGRVRSVRGAGMSSRRRRRNFLPLPRLQIGKQRSRFLTLR